MVEMKEFLNRTRLFMLSLKP